MKKTIAKIMAAAMVLSAVPAVALPTLTAQAADDDVSVSTVTSSAVSVDKGASADGSSTDLGIKVTTTDAVVVTNTDTKKSITFAGGSIEAVSSSASSTKGAEFFKNVTLAISSNGNVTLNVDTSTTAKVKTLIEAVEAGANGVTITVSKLEAAALKVQNTFKVYGEDTLATIKRYPGGKYDATKKAIVAGFAPEEGSLAEGDIYFNYTNTSALEVEVLKGANDLDKNDDLRGETLNLTTLDAGLSSSLSVVKIGAQALKKAHMKRFYAENAKRIGKGALRQCKQVTKVDICDSNKVRKINSKAFYNDKNLKNIIIDGRKLNTVGKNAFSGVKKNCKVKIKAKTSKFNADVKMIKKNGGNKNLKYIKK